MAFAFSGTSGTNNATITQTGNYTTITVTTAVTTSGTNWSFVGTLGGTVQAGATVADAVGRAIVNTTQATTITARNQIGSSWITSISSVVGGTTNVTVTGPRYFLSDGTEDVFIAAVGNVMTICQNERDLVAAATTDTNSLVDTSTIYSAIASARADIPWGTGKPNLIRLGTTAQACRFLVSAFCISDNTHIMWAQAGNPALANPSGMTLQVNGVFIMGRHFTLAVGSGFSTALLYPGVALSSDTQAQTHVAGMNVGLDNGSYTYMGGSIGGVAYGISSWTRNAAVRLHMRKATIWSVGNTVGTSTNPTIFCGGGLFSCDELTLSGTHVLQREGPTMIIYSLTNRGAGYIHAVNTTASVFNGYSNAGSQNGFDFGGYECFAPGVAGGTNASIILSYNSIAGTNCYVGSADLNFNTGRGESINIEFHRNLTLRAVNSSGTLLTTPTAYLKCATRTTGTTANAPRGAVSATPDGTQATAGVTVTSRSLTTVLTDAIQVQYDRTYTALSGSAAVDVLIGECYTNALTTSVTNVSSVGRLGYEANSGLATNRISRRGKDDTVASRTNRDNYDIYWWDYANQFGKATDFSLNANATQTQILLADTDVTQTTIATVAAYNMLETTTKVYDYFKYYKTATGTVDTRPQLARLEMGGIDGGTPGAALVSGGGGYLCYPVGSSLFFNPIFNAVTIQAGTNASPMGVLSAVGPINGSWNPLSSTYNYGDARRPTATATVQGGLTFFAGASTIAAAGNFNALNFGTVNVTLNAVATAAGNWATIAGNTITLGPTGTVFQGLSAVTSIVNLLTAGTVCNSGGLGFGTSSAIAVTGDLTFISTAFSGTCTLNVGATNRTLNLANCGNLTTTFPFLRGGTGTIAIIPSGTTVLPAVLPAGFTFNVLTTITVTLADAPATAPTIRVVEVYKNSSTTAITLPTPTYANGAFTYTNIASAPTDVYNGGIAFIDGYLPTRLTSSVNTAVSGTAINEVNVDFGQTPSATDIAFISTTSWNTANSALASNAYVSFLTTQATDYQTTPSTRTAVELAKLVWRRTYETSNAQTVIYRRLLAIGTIPTNWISFSQSGVILNQIAGIATTGLGILGNKDASRANVITFSIWAVDNLGNYYNLNNANGRVSSPVTVVILWEGFSPGAVANLNTGQINQISDGVNAGIVTNLVGTVGNKGPLGKIADGVNKGSLLIPAGVNLYAAVTPPAPPPEEPPAAV